MKPESRIAERQGQPVGLNLVERWMVELIYHRQMAERFRRFILVVLVGMTGCSVQAAPPPVPVPPAPWVCSKRPIRVILIQGLDAAGNPVEGPALGLDTAICACSDGIVRTCQ